MRKRLLDRHYHQITQSAPKGMAEPIAVDITNAAQWFFEESGQEEWTGNDFPCVSPPWPHAWLEWTNLNFVSDTTGQPLGMEVTASAIRMLQYGEYNEEDAQTALRQDWMIMLMSKFGGTRFAQGATGQDIRYANLQKALEAGEVAKWLVGYWLHIETRGRLYPFGHLMLYLNEQGKPLMDLSVSSIVDRNLVKAAKVHGVEHVGDLMQQLILPFYFALSLLHCKNVHLEDLEPFVSPNRGARKSKNSGEVVYKTLIVDPLRKQLRREKGEPGSTIQRALHICRGHFKDYREGGGLFGKLHDLYWWDMHVRGNAKHGEIKKDYKVKAPGATN